jgi:hypothetical protein
MAGLEEIVFHRRERRGHRENAKKKAKRNNGILECWNIGVVG